MVITSAAHHHSLPAYVWLTVPR